MKYPYLEKQLKILIEKHDKLKEEMNTPIDGLIHLENSHKLFLQKKYKESDLEHKEFKKKEKAKALWMKRHTNGYYSKKLSELVKQITEIHEFFIWKDHYYTPQQKFINRIIRNKTICSPCKTNS